MTFEVGYAGPDVRSDVCISVSPATQFAYTFTSSASPLYDQAIREQIESVAALFDHPPVNLNCVDSGALPFTWWARLCTAFSIACGRPLPTLPVSRDAATPSLRRTRLYVPGNTPKLIPNAALYGPDAIVLDLEESVHPERKTEALAMVLSALGSLDWGAVELMVRVNKGEQGVRDMEGLARAPVTTFVLPKVESANEVLAIDRLLGDLDSAALLFPLVESALGVEWAYEIAAASPRVTALSLGLEDYLSDLGASRTEGQSESAFARSRVLNAARAAGITPLASVYPDYSNLVGVEGYAAAARQAGYEGVGCIHPAQIEPSHLAYAYSPAEVEKAREIVGAFESASSEGASVVGVQGAMVDQPTYRRALKVVRSAEAPR